MGKPGLTGASTGPFRCRARGASYEVCHRCTEAIHVRLEKPTCIKNRLTRTARQVFAVSALGFYAAVALVPVNAYKSLERGMPVSV